MNNFYQHSLNAAKGKYYKFKRRLEKKISSGQFDALPRKKKNQLVSRVDKYKSRLEKLGFSMRGAAVAGSVTALAAIPAIGNAQDPNVFFRAENGAYTGGESPQHMELANFDSDSDLELLVSVPGGPAKLINRIEEGGEASWTRQDVTALANMRGEFWVGDIDGDQDNDVIFQNGYGFYLALNDGEGNFNLIDEEYYYSGSYFPGSFGRQFGTYDIDLVDFDSDNDLDLVMATGSTYLTVFENESGSFISGVENNKGTIPVPGYGGITDFEFTDLDGDGDMDLVSNADGGEGSVVNAVQNMAAGPGIDPVLTGGFETELGYNYNNFSGITIFDADGDGDNDVFFHRSDYSYLSGYLNQDIEGSTGTFNPTTFSGIPESSSYSVATVGVADFDLDGDDDLLLGFGFDGAYLASLNGTNFDGRSLAGGVVGSFFNSVYDVAIGDLDGDGADDFVANYGSSWLSLVYDRAAPYVEGFVGDVIIDENTPSGTLLGYLSLQDRQGDDITIVGLEGDDAASFNLDLETGALSTAEVFDWEEVGSDFSVEIVIRDATKTNREEGSIKVRNLSEEGHGTFSEEGQPVFGTATPVSFSSGDFDLDGDEDLFRSSNEEGSRGRGPVFSNSIYVQNQGFFTPTDAEPYYPMYEALFFDVDNDGRNELIGGEYDGGLDVFYFNEYGQSQGSNYNGYVGSVSQFEIGDFDGDGADDLAVLSDGDGSYLTVYERYIGNGETPLDEMDHILIGPSASMAVGDFDGDGLDDVLIANPGTDDYIYYGGEFGLVASVTAAITDNDYGLNKPVSADFDGDGDVDIALLHNTDGNGVAVDILDNNGSATFSITQTLEIGGEGSGDVDGNLAVGDIDGDGTSDLIVTFKSSYDMGTSSYTYGAATFINDGAGSFELKQSLDDVGGAEIDLMDVDGDDDLDILISATTDIEGCCEEVVDDPDKHIRVFFNSNAAPTGIELSITSFDEGVPIGESIGTLTVADPNLNDTHAIFLTAGDGTNDADNSKFVVDGDQLVVIKPIEFDEGSELNINVKAIDDYGKSVTAAFTLTVNEVPLGLDDSNDLFALYPNPGGSLMDVSLNENLSGDMEIKVSDLNGRTIYQEKHTVKGMFSTQIDMSSHKAGIYIVELKSGEQTFKQRWIKQE